MAYKTILVHVDDSIHAAARVAFAATLARQCGAHLVGAAPTGVSRFLFASMPLADADPTLALHLAYVRERAEKALAAFDLQLRAAGLASFEGMLVDDEPGGGISLLARAADLAIVTQADPAHDSPSTPADFAAYVVMNAGRAVLVLPHGGAAAGAGRRVLLSWDASKEAARALALALPLLAAAELVKVAVFDSRSGSRTVQDAAAANPLPWLARHGVTAELEVHKVEARRGPHRRHEVGEALLAAARAMDADLLVMGAYGHSRFRETILGGVTRTVFEEMTLPVLMAH